MKFHIFKTGEWGWITILIAVGLTLLAGTCIQAGGGEDSRSFGGALMVTHGTVSLWVTATALVSLFVAEILLRLRPKQSTISGFAALFYLFLAIGATFLAWIHWLWSPTTGETVFYLAMQFMTNVTALYFLAPVDKESEP